LLSDSPCTKFYALLRKQTATMPGADRSTRSIFLPSRLPFRVMERPPNESIRDRMQRYSIEVRHILTRLRFHLVEGIRLAIESARWRKAVARMQSVRTSDQRNQSRSVTCAACVPLLLSLWCFAHLHANGQSDVSRNLPATAEVAASITFAAAVVGL
jgi:hypothetical protein